MVITCVDVDPNPDPDPDLDPNPDANPDPDPDPDCMGACTFSRTEALYFYQNIFHMHKLKLS